MKIIDNRYKVKDIIENSIYFESYKVTDMWNNDKVRCLRIYNSKIQRDLITYYIENFRYLSNIRHESLLSCYQFNLIKTIDAKRTNMLLYYSVTEYNHAPKLNEVIQDLTLKERLNILLQVMLVIDFLHFRGISYKYLSPYDIFVHDNGEIKITDLSNIYERGISAQYRELSTDFLLPGYLWDKKDHRQEDYYSIGMMARYMLLEDFVLEDIEFAKYDEELGLTQEQEKEITTMISQFINRGESSSDINLIEMVDRINILFDLNYIYDIKGTRELLHFQNGIVGRQKEIDRIISIDERISNRAIKHRGILIKSDVGIGKTRLISEISHQLKLRGREVYSVEILENTTKDLLYISSILKQSIKDAPPELMEKYRYELSKILPELRVNALDGSEEELDGRTEMFRLYNRITNYFNDLSKDKIIYITIDNLHNMNNRALTLINYLIRNLKGSNIFFVFSAKNCLGVENPLVIEQINKWLKDSIIMEMELYKLNLQEIGEMLQNILGVSYIPINFATVLFKEGQGNPRYIEYIIKELFSINELHMHEKGKWFLKAEQYSDIQFPINMQDALKKQLEIVKENYFDIFKLMSIFNDIIGKKTLFDMVEEDSIDMEQILEQLIGLGLIDEKLADWGYGYSISSTELKRLIYGELSEEEKIHLHGKAADIMKEYENEEYNLVMEELLFHLIQSNQSEVAVDLIFSKTKASENKYSSYILFLWEKAYEIVKTQVSEVKLNILKNILEIYFLRGVSEKGNLYLEEYQREAEILNSYSHMINGKHLLTEKYFRSAKPDMGMEEIIAIEKISNENNIIEGKIIALIIRVKFGLRYGGLKDLSVELDKALQLSNEYGVKKYKGSIYNLFGLNEFLKGSTDEAIKNYKKSIYYHQQNGDLIESSRPINNIGTIYAEKYGNIKKAMEYYRKGLGIARQFGFQESEMIYLNNISEIYIKNHEFDKAIEYIEGAKRIAMELENLNIIFLSNVNIGFIQLATEDYKGVYGTYNYLKEMHETRIVLDVEIDTQYNNFLGEFYGAFGKWDESIYHSEIASKLCKKFNIQEFLQAESRILYMRYFKDSYFNKVEINEIRRKYKETEHIQNRRKAILGFSAISIINGDMDYARELLEEDFELAKKFKNNFLEEVREIIVYSMDILGDSMEKIIALKSRLAMRNIYGLGLIYDIIVGLKLFDNNLHEEAIKYFLENLDNIYKITLKIPSPELQTSYIESRKTDLIKERLVISFRKVFNKEIEYTLVKDIGKKGLSNYFDISTIFEFVSNEDLARITKLEHYGDAMEIRSIEDLISNFTENYKYNLDLILGYVAKESFARSGAILSYDDDLKEYIPISLLGMNHNHKINKNILNLSAQNKKGILINNSFRDISNQRYNNLLLGDIKATICVPIFASNGELRNQNERRENTFEDKEIQGYIYLETDRVFNRFDSNRLNEVINLSYLVFINLENSKLQLIATTDKLTGVCTRKHYERKFEQFIGDVKSSQGEFSLVLLDIDDFKNVNDSYGHRKGDEVLTMLGGILKSTIRNSDIVARYGGEEFIILLKNTTEKDSINIAEKIRNNVENLKVPGIDHPITISLGISLYPNHSQYREELVERADQALYCAKEMGKNRVVVWNNRMDSALNRADKLAGILTGNMNDDNRNILAMMDIIDLIKGDTNLDDKIYIFLGRLLETINAEFATIILKAESKKDEMIFTRTRFSDQWVSTPKLNYNIIEKVIENQKGEYLIDWDNIDNLDSLSGLPIWQSVILLPMIRNGELKGIIYMSVPIELKEFDFDCFNISKSFGNIFAGIL